MGTHSSDHQWQVCAGCRKQKPLATGQSVLGDHRRWNPKAQEMEPCTGSGLPPAPPTVLSLQQSAAAAAAQIRGIR